MLDLFRVVCYSFRNGMQTVEVWCGSASAAINEAREHCVAPITVYSCDCIAEGVCFN